MIRRIPRAVAAALIGALVGPALLVFSYTINPAIRVSFDEGETPAILTGFYPAERDPGGLTFAWSRPRATISLPGLSREAEWHVRIRYRGARPDPATLPDLTFTVDGKPALRRKASNDFHEARLTLPASGGAFDGATIVIAAEPGFTPGPGDRRVLGIVVDDISLTPATRLVVPPRRTIASAMTAAAAFGAGAGLLGVTPGSAIAAAVLVAAAQAPALAAGLGPYTPYPERAAALAVWIALLMAAFGIGLERARGAPSRNTARFVIAFSAGALYLKLLVLLHPQMPIVDALFQAHRFEWVLAGRYYFTQPMPGGVAFPYAIALYVFAAPWSFLTRDYTTLLRIVVCASQAIAGALLYPMIVRIRGDRLAGAGAVLLFHLAPLPVLVIGNGNLTYAFGQSAFLATIAGAILLRLGTRDAVAIPVLFLLASVGLLSHVGVAPLLATTLVAVAVLYRAFGDQPLRPAARAVAIATVAATLFSVVSYYGHFGDAYRSLAKVRSQAGTSAGAPQTPGSTAAPPPAAVPLSGRAGRAVSLTVRAIGWPILILALAGAWRVWKDGARDRLTLAMTALGVTCLVFVVIRVAAPVDRVYQRYADEFIERVNYAALPLAAVLGGFGASWAWRGAVPLRAAAAVLLGTAAWIATRSWLNWIR